MTLLSGYILLSGQKRVAVYPATGTIDDGIKEALTEAILDGISNSGKYLVIERSNFSQILQEQKFQLSGNVNDEHIVEIGRAAGAEYVCISNINKVGSNYLINYRLVDVETGLIVEKAKKTASETALADVIISISQENLFVAVDARDTVLACGLEIQKKDAGEYFFRKKDQKNISVNGWRLPTIRELKCLCEEKEKIGGFNYGEYWSSENRDGHGLGIRFNSCQETRILNKASVRYVKDN